MALRKTLDSTDSAPPRLLLPTLSDRYRDVRHVTERICAPLTVEDHVVQSMPEASPTKWHLAHTSWFFETFVLSAAQPGYRPFDPDYAYLFNSYYNAIGHRIERSRRGTLSRPTLSEVMQYRAAVDECMLDLIASSDANRLRALQPTIVLGLNHEQQHQELILTDIKHALGSNPLHPVYCEDNVAAALATEVAPAGWTVYPAGLRSLGHDGDGFAFDNEMPRHQVFVAAFRLANRLVTCGEYLAFLSAGGYDRPELWLSDGWDARVAQQWKAPLYWEWQEDCWQIMTLAGLRALDPAEPICHVSYYEADAFARWAQARLPTEAEWEVAAADQPITGNFLERARYHPEPAQQAEPQATQLFGDAWEWTLSPYTPYPGFQPAPGALGEYNGKFMCNQMVLRGGSCVTPQSHIRASYRNFFAPEARWQFTGLRLAQDV